MMEKICVNCKEFFEAGENVYFCDGCIAVSQQERIEAEARAQKVACPSCNAGVGERCATGSNSPRWPHVTREKLAVKQATKAAA